MLRLASVILVGVCLTITSPVPPLVAQELTPEQQPLDSQPTGPEPISATSVSRQAEQDILEVRDIRGTLLPSADLDQIRTEYARIDSILAELEVSTADELTVMRSFGRLEALRLRWIRYGSLLNIHLGQVGRHSEQLQQHQQRLKALDATWTATREAAERDSVSSIILARTDSTLLEIRSVESEVAARVDETLVLEDRLTQTSLDVQEVVQRLDRELEIERQRVITTDSRPIWNVLLQPFDDRPIRDHVVETLRDARAAWPEFLTAYGAHIPWHLFLTFGVLILTLAMRPRSRSWVSTDRDLGIAQAVLASPLATTLFFAAHLSTALYFDAPLALQEIKIVIGMFALFALLPRLVPPDLKRPLWLALPFFLLALVIEFTESYTAMWRIALLVESLLGIGLLTMVLRNATPWEDIGRWRKVFRIGARIIVWVLVLAAAANIFGFAALSDYLVRFVYVSIYDALVLITAALILQGLWVAILRSPFALMSQAVERHTRLLDRRGIQIIQISAVIAWAGLVLDRIALLSPTLTGIGTILSAQATFGEISISLADLLLFVLTMYLAILTSRLIRFIFEQDVAPRLSLPRGVPRAISISTQYIAVTLGFILALSVIGVDLSRLTILAGAFGLGIGIGMQDIINNFVSGLILLFERPIQIDDTIEMGPLIGRVRRIGIRSSTVRTYDGAEVIVPNASLISAEVTNWTLSDQRRRLSVSVGVAYGTDPNQVLKILKDVTLAHEKVLPEPEPWPLFLGFGDSSLDFDVRFWVITYDQGLSVRSEVATAIDRALKEADITIPFPQRDLHVKSVDGSVTEAMTREGGSKSPRS